MPRKGEPSAQKYAFTLTLKQVNALRLLALDPGEIDPQWESTLAQLEARGLVERGLEQRRWKFTVPGVLASDLVNALVNGHRLKA